MTEEEAWRVIRTVSDWLRENHGPAADLLNAVKAIETAAEARGKPPAP